MTKRTFDDKFKIGDGVSTGCNGDSYPYRIVSVSKSGKAIRIMPLSYKAIPKPDGTPYQYGDEIPYEISERADIDYSDPDQGAVYTLRKNGKWISKGAGLNDYWCAAYSGARYRQNPHV